MPQLFHVLVKDNPLQMPCTLDTTLAQRSHEQVALPCGKPVPHIKSHWQMLKVEIQRRRPAAVVGQCVRIVLGALGSAVGVVPVGNTGGTNISMFKRMPVARELQKNNRW